VLNIFDKLEKIIKYQTFFLYIKSIEFIKLGLFVWLVSTKHLTHFIKLFKTKTIEHKEHIYQI
jgi:hypothetical protein